MSSTISLFPRISPESSQARRNALRERSSYADAFSESELEEALSAPDAFPPSGDNREELESLLALRSRCLTAVGGLDGTFPTESMFDLNLGRVLFDASLNAGGEFGNPRVWDFLTLILLPDLALWRCPSDTSDFIPKLTGGNRRHVFQRLWRRWNVFGAELVESGVFGEDEYKNLLERRLTSGSKPIARLTARAIMDSGRSGVTKRVYTRTFTRQLIQLSGLVDITEGDPDHLEALFEHLTERTYSVLGVPRPEPASNLPAVPEISSPHELPELSTPSTPRRFSHVMRFARSRQTDDFQ